MTEIAAKAAPVTVDSSRAANLVRRRNAAEKRFRAYGMIAIGLALTFLVTLFGSIFYNGLSAFRQAEIRLEVNLLAEALGIDPARINDPEALAGANYRGIVRDAIYAQFPGVEGRNERRALAGLISSGSDIQLRNMVLDDPSMAGSRHVVWVSADDEIDQVMKGRIDRSLVEENRTVSDAELGYLDRLLEAGAVRMAFNTVLFSFGDSREPEQAGIWGAVMGSLFTLIVTLLLSFPIGVMAAVYLEEFAPKNRWTDLIEVNINNLAAVPSIVFGLLGLAMFLGFFGLPRSAPLVGGMVLALMTLPTIIIAGRAALKAVPPSIREAALGMGASRVQVVTHHVLPLAMPGVLTGTIIGMAQALGETAPLLMIGMVAFIVDVPGGFTDPATVLPVQIYLWADSPERAFVERTSAAIIVLLLFLVLMNLIAVVLRKRFEQRW